MDFFLLISLTRVSFPPIYLLLPGVYTYIHTLNNTHIYITIQMHRLQKFRVEISRMSRHLMWHPLSAPPVSMLLLQHLLVASISHHQQQSPPQSHIHTTPPQNYESCIHRFLLPYIVSIMHNTTIAYIVFYYSKSCIIASIILLLPLFRHKFGKSRMHQINVQILQTNN